MTVGTGRSLLARLKDAEEKATPGPWKFYGHGLQIPYEVTSTDDAALIALVRNALPAVLRLVESAIRVRNTAQGLDDPDHSHGDCPRCRRRALTKRVADLDAALALFTEEDKP